MSYWHIPEDTLYSILDLNPENRYNPDDLDRKMPDDLPKTDETREVFYNVLSDSDNFGKVESKVERVLDDVRAIAKATIDDYLVSKGVDPDDMVHELWYKNMADEFAQETLFGLRGGVPEYNEIHLTYMPAMFEYLEEPVDEALFNALMYASDDVGQESWDGWVVEELKEIRERAIEAVKTSPAAWSEAQWKEAMDNGIVVLGDDMDDSYNIYYEGHLIEQGVRDSEEATAFAKEIARQRGLVPEESIFYYNFVADDTANDYEEANSKHMFWTPRPKADPRQEKLPFAASSASYRGTPRVSAQPLPGPEVTEQELSDAIHESEIKIEMLEEAGNETAAREEQRVLDELLAMYGDDEYEWEEQGVWASTERTAARKQSPKKLAQRIKQLLDAAQAEWDEAIGRSDPIYRDVHIRVGPEVPEYIDSNAPVAITYDGAGYDMLSYEGEMEYMGGSKLRQDVMNAAAKMGYLAEDYSSWAMTFWPDEHAEPFHPEPREMPSEMRRQLEEEFGPFGGGDEPKEEPEAPPKKKHRPEEQRRLFEEMGIKTSNARRRYAADYTRVEDYGRDVLGLEEEAKKHMRFLMQSAPGMPLDVASNPNYLIEYVAEAMQHPEWLEADHATHPVWDWADEVILETFGPLSEEW